MDKLHSFGTVLMGRLAEPAPLIQVLIGPRQVGKTTAVKRVLDGRGVYETADSPTPFQPATLEEWWNAAAAHPDKILAVDEIQKVMGWAECLKRLWDTSPVRLKVVVTGSSALAIDKGLRETLAGRFELIRAEHWNFADANAIFGLSLSDYIEFGCYPGSVQFLLGEKDQTQSSLPPKNEAIERWGAYIRDSIVEPVIGRDILQLHPIEQPALLRQLFGVAVSSPAEIISFQKIQGQLQGKGTIPTLQAYLQLLNSAFVVTGIEKFSKRAFRTKASSPKLIVHDNALMRAFERPVTAGISSERCGRYLENAIGARFIEAGWDVFYWRDRKLEVDFVVHGPQGEKWAVEVKSAAVDEKELVGIRTFCRLNPDYEPCLISLATQAFSGIRSISVAEVLSFTRTVRS